MFMTEEEIGVQYHIMQDILAERKERRRGDRIDHWWFKKTRHQREVLCVVCGFDASWRVEEGFGDRSPRVPFEDGMSERIARRERRML
jgi:hypothetical protein